MDSSDFVYGLIFALYVALFVVVGGYALIRRRRTEDAEETSAEGEKTVPDEKDSKEENVGEDSKAKRATTSGRSKKKAE